MAHASAFAIDEKVGLPPARTQGSGIASYFFIGIPVLLVVLCLAAKFGFVTISAGPRAGFWRPRGSRRRNGSQVE